MKKYVLILNCYDGWRYGAVNTTAEGIYSSYKKAFEKICALESCNAESLIIQSDGEITLQRYKLEYENGYESWYEIKAFDEDE